MLLDRIINLLRFFRAHVSNRAIDQLQSSLNRARANALDLVGIAHALDMRIRAEFEIDAVGVIDRLLCKRFADQRRQIAANLIGKRELAIRKRARAGKAGRDMAIRAAVHALLRLRLRATALFDRRALFADDDLFLRAFFQHFKRSKDARRTCADDYNVGFHD